MRFLAAVLLLALPLAAAAQQTTYKCRDKAGKVTYSDDLCEKIGLKSDGEVANRVTVAPATKAPPRPAGPPAGAPPAPSALPSTPPLAPPSTAKNDDPERRCFKTAGGTRCNDAPDSGGSGGLPR